nr:MAG TPA: hypothetical protein [Caudoviricetes sp.]
MGAAGNPKKKGGDENAEVLNPVDSVTNRSQRLVIKSD